LAEEIRQHKASVAELNIEIIHLKLKNELLNNENIAITAELSTLKKTLSYRIIKRMGLITK
jgi:hypothetical protein